MRSSQLALKIIMSEEPQGELTTRTLAMPADSNPSGDIFGGWVLSQMDIAGGICSRERAGGRTVTVALDRMSFIQPVKIGDVLCVYTQVVRVGNTSLDVHVEAWAQRDRSATRLKVTEATFKFVALGEDGRPRPIDK